MAGKIKKMIDTIIQERSQGDPFLARTTRTKLLLKGINPSIYTESSEDDPRVLARLEALAKEINIRVS